MSPDTVSSLFPDRPIRPLPRRRLRERLSTEAADSIQYPTSTQENTPLFHYPPYTTKEENAQPTSGVPGSIRSARFKDPSVVPSQRNGLLPGLGDEANIGNRSTLVTRSHPEILNRTGRQAVRQELPRQVDSQPTLSAASSVDGYDSFENTNNKKKRKIPSAGESSINGIHGLGSEINGAGLSATASTPVDNNHGVERSYHISNTHQAQTAYASGNQGFSGPGRGRLGRSGNGRSPLRTLPDGNPTWPSRGAKAGTNHWSAGSDAGGIISSAIANAGKISSQGQEKNVSLLKQHSSAPKTTPASAQFTFTCDSQVTGTVPWPGNSARDNMATQTTGMQTNANMNNSADYDNSQAAARMQPSQDLKRSRRSLGRELKMAARHRRQIAAEKFSHNPPKLEDMWICEFCEYERIFGTPPRALIRDYEIKDRRHRREEADRKRLLEKAKAKSRKSKRPSKVLNKAGPIGHHHSDHMSPDYIEDHEAPHMHHGHSHSTQSEDDYDEDPPNCCGHSQPYHMDEEGDGGGNSRRERGKS